MDKVLSRWIVSLALFVCAAIASPPGFAANLVVNGGFESGATGWSFNSSIGGTGGCGGADDVGLTGTPHTGAFSAYKNCFSAGTGTISQDIATDPGRQYRVDVWVAANGFQHGFVAVSFGGVEGIADSTPGVQAYTLRSFLVTATQSTSQLLVSGSVVGGTYFFDDFSVTDVTPVPEPAMVWMTLAGLFGIGLRLRRGSDGVR